MNEAEKNKSIDQILAQGLVNPQTTGERISGMLRELGLRFIFWDTGYSLFFAAITLACTFALFMLAPSTYRISATVAVAPLLLLFAILFAETSERLGGLYQIKQTCRYTIRQIAALRILCYCALGILFTVFVALVRADQEFGFFSLFPLCLSALFVCAALSLSMLHQARNQWNYPVFSAIWLLATIVVPLSFGEAWESTLREMPLMFSIGLTVIGVGLFVWQISKMLREVTRDAIA